MEKRWHVQDTANYICSNSFEVVTLQFPDEYLLHASSVCKAVKAACRARGHPIEAYILADTTYNSLSVDEVAAAHVNARCVVHYGRASLTQLSHLPAYYVFPEEQLDVEAAAACLASCSLMHECSSTQPVVVFLDQPLLRQLPHLRTSLSGLLDRQHGSLAAAHLIFPTVPQRSMVPHQQQQQQQRQQQQQQGQAGPLSGTATCTGGASACGSLQGPEYQQAAAAQAEQPTALQAACCKGTSCGPPAPFSEYATTQGAQHGGTEPGSGCGPAGMPPATQTAGEHSSLSEGRQLSLAGYSWQLPPEVSMRDCGLVWVGQEDAPALLQLQLTYSTCRWAVLTPAQLPRASKDCCTPANGSLGGGDGSWGGALREGLPLEVNRALRRRYFLVEKAREANIVGILVGTLGAAGYADAIAALRAAAAAAGKKTYTLLMGKPSPAKLANFPEIEVFVLVADPQGQILDSKEYLAPIITPHEAQLAFAPDAEWDAAQYRLDFGGLLQEYRNSPAGMATANSNKHRGPRFSLLSGGYTGGDGSGSDSSEEGEVPGDDGASGEPGKALALHAQQALQLSVAPAGRSDLVQPRSAADYLLHKRSWQGVETPLVGAAPKPVEVAMEGRSGRAAGYADEPSRSKE